MRVAKQEESDGEAMRGESMKGKSKNSTYSTTFGVDPFFKWW